jgi:pimeloyl-ACP methyl ester carboxylesterase
VRRLVLVDNAGLKFDAPVQSEDFVPETLEDFRKLEHFQGGGAVPDFVARDLLRTMKERAWVLRRSGASLLSFQDALDGGKEDRLISYSTTTKLSQEIPQAKIVGFDGCSHLVLWECTERVMPEVLAFLDE